MFGLGIQEILVLAILGGGFVASLSSCCSWSGEAVVALPSWRPRTGGYGRSWTAKVVAPN